MSRRSRSRLVAFCLACCAISIMQNTARAVVSGMAAKDPQGVRNFVVRVENAAHERCSGVLIASNVVLTAAHCITRPAAYAITALDRHFRPDRVAIAEVAVDPDFVAAATPGRQTGVDLGLLLLSHPLGPENMPLTLDGSQPIVGGQQAVVAGYGLDEAQNRALVLRQAPLVLARKLRSAPNIMEFVDGSRQGETAGAGACQGDSGAPLVKGAAGSYQLLGIVSWSSGPVDDPRASCGGVTAVTPIVDQVEWVEQQVEKLVASAPRPPRRHLPSRH